MLLLFYRQGQEAILSSCLFITSGGYAAEMTIIPFLVDRTVSFLFYPHQWLISFSLPSFLPSFPSIDLSILTYVAWARWRQVQWYARSGTITMPKWRGRADVSVIECSTCGKNIQRSIHDDDDTERASIVSPVVLSSPWPWSPALGVKLYTWNQWYHRLCRLNLNLDLRKIFFSPVKIKIEQ